MSAPPNVGGCVVGAPLEGSCSSWSAACLGLLSGLAFFPLLIVHFREACPFFESSLNSAESWLSLGSGRLRAQLSGAQGAAPARARAARSLPIASRPQPGPLEARAARARRPAARLACGDEVHARAPTRRGGTRCALLLPCLCRNTASWRAWPRPGPAGPPRRWAAPSLRAQAGSRLGVLVGRSGSSAAP